MNLKSWLTRLQRVEERLSRVARDKRERCQVKTWIDLIKVCSPECPEAQKRRRYGSAPYSLSAELAKFLNEMRN